ncbi:DapH/DapD/GlmU-related protein [Lactobacillus intestinalis]|uniref:acyltransferase n=1 Tax=Lactobacillus intestinalis TaxID=151781 RepID=UPI00266F2F3C|nr:acyltransferase [Lactobacillus intestinalis]
MEWNSKKTTKIVLKGNIELSEHVSIGQGSAIEVSAGAELFLGKGFNCTGNTTIIVKHKISFLENVLVSWNTLFMDSDSHTIYNGKGEILNEGRPIVIHKNVWIGCNTTVLKGVVIQEGCIVGANSVLNKKIEKERCVIVGNPGRVVKENIDWKYEVPLLEE